MPPKLPLVYTADDVKMMFAGEQLPVLVLHPFIPVHAAQTAPACPHDCRVWLA